MIHSMEILQMPVAEISSELLRYAVEMPELSFQPHASGTFVSHEVDVAVSRPEGRICVEIAEPPCGDLVLAPLPHGSSPNFRLCQVLIDSIAHRRSLLQRVTDAFIAHLPDFPATENQMRMSELARLCDVHITVVSRALDNKIYGTPAGPVAFRRFIARLA